MADSDSGVMPEGSATRVSAEEIEAAMLAYIDATWDKAHEDGIEAALSAAAAARQDQKPRQDSLTDQIRDVIMLANREGCYDAADWIRNMADERGCLIFERTLPEGDESRE